MNKTLPPDPMRPASRPGHRATLLVVTILVVLATRGVPAEPLPDITTPWDPIDQPLMILEDRVFTYQNIEVHHMDTTDRWHHYRFVIEGDHQQVYIDDMEKPVFERQRPQRLGRNWATFGDSTAGAGARAQVRNVTFQRFNIDPNAGKN